MPEVLLFGKEPYQMTHNLASLGRMLKLNIDLDIDMKQASSAFFLRLLEAVNQLARCVQATLLDKDLYLLLVFHSLVVAQPTLLAPILEVLTQVWMVARMVPSFYSITAHLVKMQ